MKIVTRLRLLLFLMLLVGLVAAGLSLWNVQRTHRHLLRMDLAHRSLETHQALASNTYQLFKQYGDVLMVGDRDDGAGERELVAAIQDDIATIRELIGREIELVGEEEIEELASLAQLESTIGRLIATFEDRLTRGTPATLSKDWLYLSRVLDDDIDRNFRGMITAAIDEERDEVAETEAEIARERQVQRVVTVLVALVALGATLFGLGVLRRQVRAPLDELLAGVRAFADGDRERRLRPMGHDELTMLGNTFDAMADRIEANAARLSEQNAALEAAVEERTVRLERLLAAARAGEADRRRLLADVSHELRTPLTVIQGEADVALRGPDKPPEIYREALTRGREAARHTARLVDDLLFIARNEEGFARLQFEEVDLAALIKACVPTAGRHVRLELEADPASMYGDPGRLRQVLLVLLDNAVRHGGKQVTVRLGASAEGWRLAVEDDGPGLDDDEKEKVFERFYRGSNASARYAEGAGLGLPIVKAIVGAHEGRVSLEDRPGGGLIAVLVLPRSAGTMEIER